MGKKFQSALPLMCLYLCSCAVTGDPAMVRFATFNASMGLSEAGELQTRLQDGDDPALRALAHIVQKTRPDIILINEFDHQQGFDNAAPLLSNYLRVSQEGMEPIDYRWSYQATVNTGIDSELDLDLNGTKGEPGDAWGFGTFPGQYGMLVLSRYQIDDESVRSFRQFRWRDMPGALKPRIPGKSAYYPPKTWQALRLSSKSHWDLPVIIGDQTVHFLVSHPTPPVFDGPEDRNGRRNYDEIRLWADYINNKGDYLVDDSGIRGGLKPGAHFVIAGDQNSDPFDGDSLNTSISLLLNNPRIDTSCNPASRGGVEASLIQEGVNVSHKGEPALDTSDFSDQFTGNLRLDYVLPSSSLNVGSCGVFWPASDDPDHDLISHSDHRLVWMDITIPEDQ